MVAFALEVSIKMVCYFGLEKQTDIEKRVSIFEKAVPCQMLLKVWLAVISKVRS